MKQIIKNIPQLIPHSKELYPFLRLLFILLVGFAGSLRAQVITLDSVIARIAENNLMLQEYDEKIKAIDTYSEGAKSWMAPMIGGGTFMTPYPSEQLMDDGDKGSWMFSIEQEIPGPGKLQANRDYLRSKSAVERESKEVQFNALKSEAKFYYYNWLVAAKKLKVLEESQRIIELMLKLARIRYPYNQGTLGNIYKTEGRLSEVENMKIMTQSQIEDNSYRLKALMNVAPTDSIMVDTTTLVTFNFSDLEADTSGLSDRRSDIRKIDQTIEVMKLNQQLQRAQSKPDLRIRFDHMEPRVSHMPRQFSAMAMISIPIAPWSSKMYRAEEKGMQYDIEAMQKNRQAILTETRGMVSGMGNQIRRMQQQLVNYETKIIPALQKNYQTLMLAYEENREQLPMVIDGWEALNMAQMEYLEKLQEQYVMIVNYEKEIEK
jgi:outer membrane protein, heavy metal efflux system